jgi:7-keto-8-aminopelargonate synthetase-like enzyme
MAARLKIDGNSSPILPLVLGKETRALKAAEQLRDRGIFIPAIRYPTVARGKARLRVTVTAGHTADDIRMAGEALTAFAENHDRPD